MASQAKFGKGAALTRAGYAISEILDISVPKRKTKDIDVTNHDSPSNAMESIPGMIDGGTVDVTCNFRPGDTNGQMGLIADQTAGTIQAFVLTAPAAIGVSYQFNGFVVEAAPIFPADKQAQFKASIRITGPVIPNQNASADLTTLVASDTTLIPTFSGAVYEYGGIVAPSTASVTFTPTMATAESITVNGTVVASGAASGAILTPVGNTNVTVITKDATKSPKVYQVHLSRAS